LTAAPKNLQTFSFAGWRRDGRVTASMLRGGFFFLDVVVDQARHPAAAKAARRLMFGFAFRITHEAAVKRFLGADEVVVVKRQLAALTTL